MMLDKRALLAACSFVTLCVSKILYAGVNESGGEFASGTLPGTFGVDYQFIDVDHVDYFIDHGVNVFRVTFLMVSFAHFISRGRDGTTY